MKTSYLVVGSLFTFTFGIAATLGVHASLSNQSRPVSAQQPTLANAPQPVQPQPARSFESLSLCEQLDTIAKSGKSVAQFIAASGRYSEFAANVRTYCTWHAGQVSQAYAILNPPVATIRPQIIQQPVVINRPVSQPIPLPQVSPHIVVINTHGNPIPGRPSGRDEEDSIQPGGSVKPSGRDEEDSIQPGGSVKPSGHDEEDNM